MPSWRYRILPAGIYQLWIDIDIHPNPDSWDVEFTVRGGPFGLLLDEPGPNLTH